MSLIQDWNAVKIKNELPAAFDKALSPPENFSPPPSLSLMGKG